MKVNKVRALQAEKIELDTEKVEVRRELQQPQSKCLDPAQGQLVNANDKSCDGLLAFIFGLATLWFRLLQRRH